jgi:hypothetical protein
MELSFSPFDESKITCTIDFNALATIAMIHITKPYKWKLASLLLDIGGELCSVNMQIIMIKNGHFGI